MVSIRRLSRLFSVSSRMCSGGKTSVIGVVARPGHLRFFGGTFVATYSFLPGCRPRRSPSSFSLRPMPYAKAVSKKLHPSSTARSSDRCDSTSSEPVQPPIPHIPYPISDTCQPSRPKRRLRMFTPHNLSRVCPLVDDLPNLRLPDARGHRGRQHNRAVLL